MLSHKQSNNFFIDLKKKTQMVIRKILKLKQNNEIFQRSCKHSLFLFNHYFVSSNVKLHNCLLRDFNVKFYILRAYICNTMKKKFTQ